jgi:predicted nicotinamide N-methyase
MSPVPAVQPTAVAPAPDQPYQIKFETVNGCGDKLQLRSLLDRQQYHDPLGEAESEGISSAAWPIFGMLWPSGRVLAHVMLTFEIRGKRILELGCGLALPSLVLHRRGGDVTASDCHPLAASFLLENLSLNDLPPMKYQPGNWSRSNPLLGCFDLIIGSDVLYDREQPQALAEFIDLHAGRDVEVLIVDPNRGNWPGFNRRMTAQGFWHTETPVFSLPGAGGAYKGRVLRYRRGAISNA